MARWGGDEFALLVPEGERSDVEAAARRLQAAAREFGIDLSAGWAVADGTEGLEAAMARAYAELYRNKRGGR